MTNNQLERKDNMARYQLSKSSLVLNGVPQDSPVERRRKELSRGNGDWAGYAHVYANIARGCEAMARTPYVHLSDEHVNAMAVLGCGDEQTMKYEQMRMRDRGFIR
ncbi:MAG TPA: hypothetical protein VET48_12340 [Steroidobacteraceae bacterium]|nr:hypothetical protein [Steroidobacteraceae bacterium]